MGEMYADLNQYIFDAIHQEQLFSIIQQAIKKVCGESITNISLVVGEKIVDESCVESAAHYCIPYFVPFDDSTVVGLYAAQILSEREEKLSDFKKRVPKSLEA